MDHPHEFVGLIMMVAATAVIYVNALFLQRGPHPAPIFATRAPATAVASDPAQLVMNIQRALARRGLYPDTVDGIWGVHTDAAVREFVRVRGLNIEPAPSASLLRAIVAAPVPKPTAQEMRQDPIARLLAPSKHILAVQTALADFGYGQIKPTGVYDADTRAAIEKFERDRRMPVTGQLSERVVRALAAMTGRPLE
jgi:peptidoglycan hydrolase-like protein with peptidoglycan-binding domain